MNKYYLTNIGRKIERKRSKLNCCPLLFLQRQLYDEEVMYEEVAENVVEDKDVVDAEVTDKVDEEVSAKEEEEEF